MDKINVHPPLGPLRRRCSARSSEAYNTLYTSRSHPHEIQCDGTTHLDCLALAVHPSICVAHNYDWAIAIEGRRQCEFQRSHNEYESQCIYARYTRELMPEDQSETLSKRHETYACKSTNERA
jgi:hypothetical protein